MITVDNSNLYISSFNHLFTETMEKIGDAISKVENLNASIEIKVDSPKETVK